MGSDPNRELVDYEAAARIFAERRIPAECPICAENAWAPMGTLGNLYLAIPLMERGGELLQAGDMKATALALGYACGNCGFVRLVSEDMLARLRDESRGAP